MALPYHPHTLYFPPIYTIHAVVRPLPYRSLDVTWNIDGDAAKLAERNGSTTLEPGTKPGIATLTAVIGAPIGLRVTRHVHAYDVFALNAKGMKLVINAPTLPGLPTGFPSHVMATLPNQTEGSPHGIRFTYDGFVEEPDEALADIFLSPDAVLHVPGGAVLLTNGTDRERPPLPGVRAGAAFTDLTSAPWRHDYTTIDARTWAGSGSSCFIAAGPGIARREIDCPTTNASVILFKTRDGRYVKWHVVNSDGTMSMGGPYEIL